MDEPTKRSVSKTRRLRSELDQLLDLAEKLKQRCEDNIARREKLKLMQFMSMGLMSTILLLCMTVASLLISSERTPLDRYILLFVPVGFLPVFVGFYFYFNRMQRRYFRWFLTDSFALKEVVRLLRETEGAMLGTTSWSALDRARLHIQLARFSIGDEFEEDFPRAAKREKNEALAYVIARKSSDRIASQISPSES